MENNDRTLKELATPDVVYQPWCIQYPQLEPAQTYELKSGLIHLLPKFHGLAGEDPHKHLKEFHVVCSTMRPQGILEDYIKMKAFPFSLDGAAKDWLEGLAVSSAKYYIWDDLYLWKRGSDQVICRCIPDFEISLVLHFFHATTGGGHHGSTRTTRKVLDCGFYWPTTFRDAHQFISAYEQCQRARIAMSRRHEMLQHPILFCEVFDVWGIDFMGPFPVSNGYSYILLAVDYMSRWLEAVATKTNDAKVVVNFLKSNIFYRFGVPKTLISDQGSHFCNRAMTSLLEKYGVVHRIATAYHPQTNSQAEVFNKEIKKILQKLTNPD
ncbi:pol, partial [Mucuna pruriens]